MQKKVTRKTGKISIPGVSQFTKKGAVDGNIDTEISKIPIYDKWFSYFLFYSYILEAHVTEYQNKLDEKCQCFFLDLVKTYFINN